MDPRPRLGGAVTVPAAPAAAPAGAAAADTQGVVVRLGVQKLFVRLSSALPGGGGELRRLAVAAVTAQQTVPATIERFPTSDDYVQLWASLLTFAMDAPLTGCDQTSKSPVLGENLT